MRVELADRVYEATPGQSIEVELEVFNTQPVIDGITARVIGLDPNRVTSHPIQLALLPQTSGRLRLRAHIPPEFPAGRHLITVEVRSAVPDGGVERCDLELNVARAPRASLLADPRAVTSRRRAEFALLCDNVGNTPVVAALTASDPQRALEVDFSHRILEVPPGSTGSSRLTVTARRKYFGGDLTHPLTVQAEGAEVELKTEVTFTQRPILSRGWLTMAILGAVVALWALAMLFGLTRILNGNPATKQAPASFFAATVGAGPDGVPPGGMSKQGATQAVAGTVSGTAVSAITGKGVPRLTVQALYISRTGPKVVGSAATGTDGAFSVDGLLPGTYKLRVVTPGYRTTWYPAATSLVGASNVNVAAQKATKGLKLQVQGLPGTISGKIDTGQTSQQIPVTVQVHAATAASNQPLQTTTVTNGTFSLANLPTPDTYDVTFTAPGYQPATVTVPLSGGQTGDTSTVRMSAGSGTITGTVTDGRNPVGGVTITAMAGTTVVKTATPTVGSVGVYALTGLPTPGAYLLSFDKPGFGSQTIAVNLTAGQSRTGVNVVIVSGTGTISGRVTDAAGQALGDVSVRVDGGTTSLSTKTFTSGAVGSYTIANLPPGTYSVTFSAPNYASQTLTVDLTNQSGASNVNAALGSSVGTLQGTVTSGGHGLAGVSVSVTNGTTVVTTTTVSSPAGSYLVRNLPAGTYSVTFSKDGQQTQTVQLTVAAGGTATQNIDLVPSS
jgi:hypothetical protein